MVPRLRSKEELKQDIKIKKKWKDPGFANDYFYVPPPVKPNVLNEWVAMRTLAPDRTFKKLTLN